MAGAGHSLLREPCGCDGEPRGYLRASGATRRHAHPRFAMKHPADTARPLPAASPVKRHPRDGFGKGAYDAGRGGEQHPPGRAGRMGSRQGTNDLRVRYERGRPNLSAVRCPEWWFARPDCRRCKGAPRHAPEAESYGVTGYLTRGIFSVRPQSPRRLIVRCQYIRRFAPGSHSRQQLLRT
jgi:hypothetical protein